MRARWAAHFRVGYYSAPTLRQPPRCSSFGLKKKVFYFAVADGCCDPETGEKDDAGLQISADGILTADDAIRLAEQQLPCYAGRLRQITEEEYLRDFGDDE